MAKVCPNCELTYSDEDFFCAADGSPLRSTGADADNLVGTVIADRYRIEAILGEGGMGRVYRARHVRVPREAAIKVLRRALIADAYAVAAFNREARNAASVGDHPNVASVYDFGETADGLVFLAMEYIEGETLSRRLEREPVLSPRRAAEIVRQIAAGLTAAHELPEPVVHRDLKPDNILLKSTRDGTDWVKVVDFGIAKAAKRDTQMLTTPGLVVGTPRYMSPEQLTGGVVDTRSDIYALGMIAFQMLTGRMPFASSSRDEESTIQWALQRLTLKPLTLKQVRPDVDWPVAVQTAIDHALATAAADRAPSANEFARSLAHGFGLTTPSGVVGIVPEVPGPVSSAVRSAAQSTAPTAPLAAATDAGPRSPARGSAEQGRPVGAPARSVPDSPSTPVASGSRSLVALVGGLVIVAAVGGWLWVRNSRGTASEPSATAAPHQQPNESASRVGAVAPSAPPSTRVPDSQPAVAPTRDSSRAASAPTSNRPASASLGTGASPTSRPNPTSATADATAAVRARTELDRIKAALADLDAVAAAGSGNSIIRDLRRLMPALTARADSVEATYYLIETNLVLDRPREACILLARIRRPSRGSPFEAGVDRFLSDSTLACGSRRQ
jgi:serine/threonine-protein kinase